MDKDTWVGRQHLSRDAPSGDKQFSPEHQKNHLLPPQGDLWCTEESCSAPKGSAQLESFPIRYEPLSIIRVWFVQQRIREPVLEGAMASACLTSQVEMDETCLGGKECNKHRGKKMRVARDPVDKQAWWGSANAQDLFPVPCLLPPLARQLI